MDAWNDPVLDAFADEVRTWIEEHCVGEFAAYRGRGWTGQEDVPVEVQWSWEKELASGGWLGIDFPAWIGGRGCSLAEQVVFHRTYVESRAPGRLPNMGLTLLGPTLMSFGSESQQRRFVPRILTAQDYWCQGYSEPDAGSDLANVKTRAELVDGRWIINGQKVWTSLAQYAQWIFLVARTEAGSQRHAGLSYLLVPMDQPGIEIRPIVQITGGSEFNETFFSDAHTEESLVVGGAGNGWKVAMGTLGFERGASTLGQQVSYRQEFDDLVALAKDNGRLADPVVRQELTRSFVELEILRFNQFCAGPRNVDRQALLGVVASSFQPVAHAHRYDERLGCRAPKCRSASFIGRRGIVVWVSWRCWSVGQVPWSGRLTRTTVIRVSAIMSFPIMRSTVSSAPFCTAVRTPSMAAPIKFNAT